MSCKLIHCKRNHFLMLVCSVEMTVTGCFEKKLKYLFYGFMLNIFITHKKILRVGGKNRVGRVTPINFF